MSFSWLGPTERYWRTDTMAGWIAWTDDLQTQVERIDEQHKEMFRQFNELGEAVWDGKGKEAIGNILVFLADYTVRHFRDEETLMVSHHYPHYTTHKTAHDEFVSEVDVLVKSFKSQEYSSALTISVLSKVGEWTRQHIRGMDKAMGLYVKNEMS
jgi:hemerythrin